MKIKVWMGLTMASLMLAGTLVLGGAGVAEDVAAQDPAEPMGFTKPVLTGAQDPAEPMGAPAKVAAQDPAEPMGAPVKVAAQDPAEPMGAVKVG